MKKIQNLLIVLVACFCHLSANAKTDIDFSSKFQEGTNTIVAPSAWGWYSVGLSNYEIQDAEYLYIQYESSCSFNLILQDQNWQNAYSVKCTADATEAYIQLTPGAYEGYACVVIQNRAEGEITINKIYFCSEEEFYNPKPDDTEEARQNLIDIYARYQKLLSNFTVGTSYGCYPADKYQAFSDALDAALVLDSEDAPTLTAEQLNAMSQAIVDTYKELVASLIKYLPADGYYRLVCARQFYKGDDESGYTYFTKGLYCTNTGTNGWKTLDEADPAFLWTLQHQSDDTYLLTNAANQLVFTDYDKCSSAVKYISIDPIAKPEEGYQFNWNLCTDEDVTVFNFRMSTSAANDYKYVHMKNHNSGQGESGPMTDWCNTTNESGASEWFLQPVDEELAQTLLGANAYGHDFIVMLEDAKQKVAIANDKKKTKLITDASQFSSPFSQNDLGNKDGGNLAEGVLIDGDNSTFWHSVWSVGSAEMGSHYLQVELPDEVSGDIEFDFARRLTSSNHVTTWGIYGSNQPDGEKYDYEWIADLETPYGEQGEYIASQFQIEEGKSYQYLRFYAEGTSSNNGYWHISELQLYLLQDNPTNQAAHMGEVYTNLVNAIQQADLVDQNAVSLSDYEALKSVYDPFIALFVDPSPLRSAIDAAEPAMKLYEEGNNPGQWSAGSTTGLLQSLQDAKTYDQSGQYTQSQTDAYVEALSDASTKLLSQANKVSPDKYYAIRFASEDKYAEQGWSTSNVLNSTLGDLYDTYLCPAEKETLEILSSDDVRQGTYMFFTDDQNADIAFRFVPVGEDTYAIQHQATGLFIQVYGYDSWTGLTLNPTLFTVEAVGHGENTIHATNYEGKDLAYLHAQLSEHRLVTWHDHYAGSNSGLIIEEIEGVTDLPDSPMADYRSGELTTQCYPVSVIPAEGTLYSVAGTYTSDDKMYVALNRVSQAEPGQPLVYVAPASADSIVTVALNVGTELAKEAKNESALQGVYESTDLTESALIFVDGICQMSTEETAHVASNHAYLLPDAVTADASISYDLVIEVGTLHDGLQQVLNRMSQPGNIYNAAGQLVRTRATLHDAQDLPSGMYIINGIKILVK